MRKVKFRQIRIIAKEGKRGQEGTEKKARREQEGQEKEAEKWKNYLIE